MFTKIKFTYLCLLSFSFTAINTYPHSSKSLTGLAQKALSYNPGFPETMVKIGKDGLEHLLPKDFITIDTQDKTNFNHEKFTKVKQRYLDLADEKIKNLLINLASANHTNPDNYNPHDPEKLKALFNDQHDQSIKDFFTNNPKLNNIDQLTNLIIQKRLQKCGLSPEQVLIDETIDWGHRQFATCPQYALLQVKNSPLCLKDYTKNVGLKYGSSDHYIFARHLLEFMIARQAGHILKRDSLLLQLIRHHNNDTLIPISNELDQALNLRANIFGALHCPNPLAATKYAAASRAASQPLLQEMSDEICKCYEGYAKKELTDEASEVHVHNTIEHTDY